jgi:carotenoid cleavage dioxygenase-like enzyme
MHSFGLSERWIVLAEFPYVVNPLRLATSGRPYIENYRWKPELGTRFTLIDRSTGEAQGPFSTDACFGFHHVNAYEDGDEARPPGGSRTSTSRACAPARRWPRPGCGGSGSGRARAV